MVKGKKKKLKSRRVEHGFVTYGGHMPELDMMVSEDGYYFKMYLAGGAEEQEPDVDMPPERQIETMFRHTEIGFKFQLIVVRRQIYILMGTRADTPEEAKELFEELEKGCPYQGAACEEWFELMSERLLFEPLAEFPEKKQKKKCSRISLVQPYNVKKGQKEMELSGRTVKTILLMGYPSRLFEAFATELLGIAENLSLAVYAEELDPKRCLNGMNLSGNIRPARRMAMKGFLGEAIKSRTHIYNTCPLIAIDGLPGEVGETFQLVKRFCEKYLISVSELDYQQADAWKSSLPLMKNRIRYHRVLTRQNLMALFPWSELKRCKRTVSYGTDAVSGQAFYDRRIHRENGFILAGDYDWTLEQAAREIAAYMKTPLLSKEKIYVLADESVDTTLLGQGMARQIEISCEEAPLWLLKAMVARWAISRLSTNGRTMKKHIDMVMKAVESLEEGKGGTVNEEKAGVVEIFLSRIGEQERRALLLKPFIPVCRFQVTETTYGNVYQVMESGIQAEIGYALMFWKLHGMVYSLNSELLAWNLMLMYRLHEDSMYTFLTRDNRTLYESRNFSALFRNAPFLLVGEHGIFEKLRLSEAVGLDKEQRNWISESAKGAVLMTKLAAYQLVRESRNQEKLEEGRGID